jgi:hypothetical protein
VTSWTKVRSQLARAVRDGEPAARIDELRRELRAARAETYLLGVAPALTNAQRAHLAIVLLRDPPGGDGNAAA